MSQDRVPVRKNGLKSTLLPDGYLVITIESSNEAITLNPMGAAVWEFCDGQHPLSAIVEELVELGVPNSEGLNNDVSTLLDELLTTGLIEM
jgi:hypothetical protein